MLTLNDLKCLKQLCPGDIVRYRTTFGQDPARITITIATVVEVSDQFSCIKFQDSKGSFIEWALHCPVLEHLTTPAR